jgi:4-hydroxy-tetrahydrodipicolinate synthase
MMNIMTDPYRGFYGAGRTGKYDLQRAGQQMKKLYGVISAMTTPFDASDHVDEAALEKQTEFLISKGVNCLYPCGTTGEMHLMSAEERELAAETVIKKAAGRVPVFIHTGAMTQEETIRLSLHALRIGADGIGVVTPSYFKISDRAMVQYYCDITRKLPSDFPVYVYAIPQLAGNDVSAPVLEEIASRCSNAAGVKYSYPDMNRLAQYLNIKTRSLSVLFGADQLFLPALVMGCDGTVSGCSGAMPEPFVELYSKYRAGDLGGAGRAQTRAAEAVRILQGGADMAIFKAVLSARGVPGGFMRKPLRELGEEEKERIITELRRLFSI